MTAKTAAFTPGPWKVQAYGKLKSGSVITQDMKLVASIYTTRNSEKNRDANANLIAAAPDMLAALKLARSTIIASDEEEEHPLTVHALNAIDAAIKKAEAIYG